MQFKLFKLREVPTEIYATTWLGQNTEGSVFEFQPTNVSAITSSVKTPNQAETVQIRTQAATSIWAGSPPALTCTLFDKCLPGCYKGNGNKVRNSLQLWTAEIPLHQHDSGCTRAHIPNSQQSFLHLHTFITASVREGDNTISAQRNQGQNSVLYTTALVSIGQVKFDRKKPSTHTNTNTHSITILNICLAGDVVVNDFRWYVGYEDAHKRVGACVCW